MSVGGKSDAGRGGGTQPRGEGVDDSETFGDGLLKAGFEAAKVGRKIVSQGKRREALKKRTAKVPDR